MAEVTVAQIRAALALYKGIQSVYRMGDDFALVYTQWGVFTLSDNGGEINVHKVNAWDYPESIPLTWFDTPLNAHTMVYRVLQVMQGLPIDYTHRVANLFDEDTADVL